ncbi:hypothetical protein [Arthrobacter jinronghuae]|uniref:Uncharacterized protein n=1 Tax=Arthrobacter jinronghuae TaxID=2964609 RepID=A0ABT1NTE2_9MICC|nr:hypothetical protein [Arthrobacter jinronghuae]MCQ1951006.1 hypothetical protein [Arthrobacter jinronghuae]MCQ1954319.1 hypothetical protein [Arthrobacter sp. zg-Y238]MCQ1957195.1 hypothetical protein [Arthrobacter jinronghuae]UWX79461.1 hypothetical protein N2K98_04445 [Arthrobacter jinronghuae]
MNFLYSLATAATPAPEESLAPGVAAEDVTPGTLGFLFTLFVVIAIIFLIRDMTKRIRRVRYREQVLATQEAAREDAGRDASGPAPAKGTPGATEERDTTWDHLR